MAKLCPAQIQARTRKHMKTVLFDLDGTLINHFGAIARSINHAQRQLGLPESSLDTVKAAVGGGYKSTLQRLFGNDLASQADPHFLEFFNAHLLEDIHILPGAREILQALHLRGKQLAVLTNKNGDAARRILQHTGMDAPFDVILGAGDTPHRKPDPAFTRAILDQLGAIPEDSLLVGDSPYDFEAARNVGMACCLVTTGSHTAEQLTAETSCREIFDDLNDLARELLNRETECQPA